MEERGFGTWSVTVDLEEVEGSREDQVLGPVLHFRVGAGW